MAKIEKIKISDQCIGCGTCERECNKVFRLVHQTKSEVVTKDFETHEKSVVSAFRNCPIQGIQIVSDDESLQTLWRSAIIIEKTALTDTVFEVKIRSTPYDFKPGQYLTVQFMDDEGSFNRAYSIAAVDRDVTTLLVGIMADGRASEFVKECEPPSEIMITEPRGDFVLMETDAPKTFVATGTGLAPIIPMIESAPDAKKTLYFGVRREQDLFYVDRLKKTPNLDIKVCLDFPDEDWSGPTGNVVDFLKKDDLDPASEVYTCGNDGMMEALEALLKKRSHDMDLFHRESFSPATLSLNTGSMVFRTWIRNVHVYASLVMCMVFMFFGLTGFMANRPELFGSKTTQTLPENIMLEKDELAGYLKSHLPETATFKDFLDEDGFLVMSFDNGKAASIEVEVVAEDRTFTITKRYPLPKTADVTNPNALAKQIAEPLSGKLDEKTVEADDEGIYFSVVSVWRDATVEVDTVEKSYEIIATDAPWVTALTNLHRGKNAGPLQKLFIDASGILMALVTITGMIYAIQSGQTHRRVLATILILASTALAIAMLANR